MGRRDDEPILPNDYLVSVLQDPDLIANIPGAVVRSCSTLEETRDQMLVTMHRSDLESLILVTALWLENRKPKG